MRAESRYESVVRAASLPSSHGKEFHQLNAPWARSTRRLGDQTLYSIICMHAPQLCYTLPCEWNRQLSTRFYAQPTFKARHRCDGPGLLIHGNQPLLERLVFALQLGPGRPSCMECRVKIGQLRHESSNHSSANPRYRWGADKEWMVGIIEIG